MAHELDDKPAPPRGFGLEGKKRRYRRSTATILRERNRIIELYAEGKKPEEIAPIIGRHPSEIQKELAVIKEMWANSGMFDFSTAIAAELQKITEMELEYQKSWVASLSAKETITIETLPDGTQRKVVKAEVGAGDPRYMQGIQWCIQKRVELLGLDAPKRFKIDVSAELISFANEHGLTASHILADPVLYSLYQQAGADIKVLGAPAPDESAGMGSAEKLEARPDSVLTPSAIKRLRAQRIPIPAAGEAVEGEFKVVDPSDPSSEPGRDGTGADKSPDTA